MTRHPLLLSIHRHPLRLLILLAFVTACGGEAGTKEAQVARVYVDPATQLINVEGTYGSSCERIADITEAVAGTTTTITLLVSEDSDLDCSGGGIPFTTAIPTALDLSRQGRYTIYVNEVSTVVAVNAAGEIVTSSGTTTRGIADVASAELVTLTTVPVQVALAISGTLPDACTAIAQIDQSRRGAAFTVTVETVRDETATCPDAPVPFSENVSLALGGLPAGEYTVQIQDINRSFTLAADNVDVADMARCGAGEPVGILFANVADGYCLQYPAGFLPATPRGGLMLLEERDPGEVRVILTIERRGAAGGRAASQLADQAVLDLPVPAIDIVRSTMLIGGAEAVVLDLIPGAVASRQAFLVNGEDLYVLTLLPVGEEAPEAVAQAAALWNMVTQTVQFLEE